MKEIDLSKLDKAIENLKDRHNDLDAYAKIMGMTNNKDTPIDTECKRTFNSFYKVRRNSEWREKYYQLFEEARKKDDLSFEFILRKLYELTGRIEASFASKMFATLRPDMPIWDSVVLANFELKPVQSKNKEKRIQNAVNIYDEIVHQYDNLEDKQLYLSKFDENFPAFCNFSETKKIDFILWQMRK